jgi:hydroxypyruvate reductase
MALGAFDALGHRIETGLVITKTGHCGPLPWPCHESGHPLPNEASLAAGRRLLEFLASAPEQAHFLVLISGGASALVELLPPPLGIAELLALHRWLLGSGLPIAQINQARKRVSLLKGGRLAEHLGGRAVTQLLISDVADDEPADIGSGLLLPDPTRRVQTILPDWAKPWQTLAPPAPEPDADCFRRIHTSIVARLDDAVAQAVTAGQELGYRTYRHSGFLAGEAAEVGRDIAQELQRGPPGLHVWGGETVVRLAQHPGRGGRNQHLALAAAGEIVGRSDLWLLAAGTDGSDGPTLDAGALVDGGTLVRGAAAGLNAASCLEQADAGSYLAASGDLIRTGPTGTNVMDLVLGLKQGGRHATV